MSKIVLGWRLDRPVENDHIRETVERIKDRYQPLFQDPIRQSGLWSEKQGLLHFDMRATPDPGLHITDDVIACLTGKPTITSKPSAHYRTRADAKFLAEQFASAPESSQDSLLAEINPPFTVCWFDKAREQVGIVHDGLGEDQFFLTECGNGIVFSNKCWPILQFLGMAPRIALAAWKYWFCMGWFPGLSTPFEKIRVLDEGEIVTANALSVVSRRANAFASWLKPSSPAGAGELMSDAAESLLEMIRQSDSGDGLQTDLTAGLDTRAICAALIKENRACRFYTGGPRFSPDVAGARRIAKKFGLQWNYVPSSTRFSARPAGNAIESQFQKMLLWSEGLVEPLRFPHFRQKPAPIALGTYLSGGSSEISKAHYYSKSLRKTPAEGFELARTLRTFESLGMQFTSQRDAIELVELVRSQIARGESYGLSGFALLDWFYLTERVRRWQSAHIAANLFDRGVLPFVNVEHIRLAFAMEPLDKAHHRFQHFIIEQNAADLLTIPLNRAPAANALSWCLHQVSRVPLLRGVMNDRGWEDYLRGAGRQAVDRVFLEETPLWQILDKEKSRDEWKAFLEGRKTGIIFPFSLIAFRHWYQMYIEPDGK